ncbi:MAG: serine hydrolase domain-containing protein [Pseudomonadota bacterium]
MALNLKSLLISVVIMVTPASSQAQQTNAERIFRDAAAEQPGFAIGLSYAFGQDAPAVLTEGPTVKGGTTPVADEAAWHIGSIGKSFTASLVMRLVERGVLDLDAPIGPYIADPEYGLHPDWQKLNLRHLLSHRAGLPANPPMRLFRETAGHEPRAGRLSVLSQMWGKPLPNTDEAFLYSNVGYVLAGFIVEEVAGAAWEALIQTEIAQPLKLASLGFGAPDASGAAWGHRSVFGFKRPVAPDKLASDNPRWMGPAGTLHLNLADLVRWGQAHLDACAGRSDAFLSQTSCQLMQTPVAPDYGLGWVIQETGGGGHVVWHNGSNTMWYAVLFLVPEDDLVIALTTNVFAPDRIDSLVRELASALRPSP